MASLFFFFCLRAMCTLSSSSESDITIGHFLLFLVCVTALVLLGPGTGDSRSELPGVGGSVSERSDPEGGDEAEDWSHLCLPADPTGLGWDLSVLGCIQALHPVEGCCSGRSHQWLAAAGVEVVPPVAVEKSVVAAGQVVDSPCQVFSFLFLLFSALAWLLHRLQLERTGRSVAVPFWCLCSWYCFL